MVFDEIRTLRTIEEAPNDFTIKIFLYLAMNQPNDGIRGYKIDKTQLQFDLKLTRTIFFDSLHWLKERTAVCTLRTPKFVKIANVDAVHSLKSKISKQNRPDLVSGL